VSAERDHLRQRLDELVADAAVKERVANTLQEELTALQNKLDTMMYAEN
jgi:hypothetical protein